MRWIEAIPGILILGALAWFAGWVAWAIIYIPVRACLDVRNAKLGRPMKCYICKEPVVKRDVFPIGNMYASVETRSECPNGHVSRSGGRRFAEW